MFACRLPRDEARLAQLLDAGDLRPEREQRDVDLFQPGKTEAEAVLDIRADGASPDRVLSPIVAIARPRDKPELVAWLSPE